MSMKNSISAQRDHFSGQPIFSDMLLARRFVSHGIQAAWHTGYAERGASMLEGVRGDFAVGMKLQNGKVFWLWIVLLFAACAIGSTETP